ncbi:MAG: hypothetical protein U0228_08000 [Myxococcaceae bacterium]
MLTLALAASLVVSSSLAQTEWSPPPMTSSSQPTGKPAPAPVASGDDVRFGVQFHGDVSGGTGGFGGAVSVGLGWNRVALLLTPSLSYGAVNTGNGVLTVSGDVSVRIYLHARAANLLVAYLRPSLGVGAVFTGSFNAAALLGVGFAAGGEYLLNPHLGFSAELGVRLSGTTGLPAAFATIGSLGIVLHQ